MRSTHRHTISKRGFPDLSTRPFQFRIKGKIFEGFVVRKGDCYFAYQNLCQHLPITLDLKDNRFFTHDKKHLQCHMHGAIYEIESGVCTGGPCVGARLIALEVEEVDSQLVITVPESFGIE